MDINRSNYESFFLLYLDRELNAVDQGVVENFLNENTDLQKEFRLLQKTIQWPAEVIFDQKESLYRREEKRRFIPVYWARIAAVFIIILAAGWYMMTVSSNHQNDHSVEKPKLSALDRNINPTKQQTSGEKVSAINMTEKGNPGKMIFSKNEKTQKGITDQAKTVNVQKNDNQDIRRGNIQHVGNEQIRSATNENEIAVRKSNADLELETTGSRNGPIIPGTVSAPVGVQYTAVFVAVAHKNAALESEDSGERNIQTENAISVIALNDQNKAITGFLKKLTKHAPAEETADNNKKLRVSVFQISY